LAACCSSFTCAAGAQFDAARADADLARYRKRGPDPTTRLLTNAVRTAVNELPTLLDIGAGIGILTHELVDAAAASATIVEASDAYLRIAQEEAARRGNAARYTFHHGDFLTLAPDMPEAHTVTMDRVICCYQAYQALLDAALSHARNTFAFSYPRDRWYVRLAMSAENLIRRFRRNPFRTFMHPPHAMHAVAERHGFRLLSREHTLAWCVELWQRTSTAQPHR
jgi:magnesium-protoporphyrin O-methyltransferase